MAKSPPRARKAGRKAGVGSKARKPVARTRPAAGRKTSSGAKIGRRKQRSVAEAGRTKRRRAKAPQTSLAAPAETRKSIPALRPTPAPEKPPRLLLETRSTASALNLLEKAIKLLYYKDFRRARAELHALLDNHPNELEIAAKARSYLQICDREAPATRRSGTSQDQIYNLGVVEHNRGNFDDAIALFRQALGRSPDADYVYYSMASSHALKGETEKALEHLRKAVGLNEANRIYARNDTDFISLHENREFADLVGVPLQAKAEP